MWKANAPDSVFGSVSSLNLIDDHGNGLDPMSGLMRAMSGNEDAAESFFDPLDHPDRIDYLLTDRAWFPDTPSGSNPLEMDPTPSGLDFLGNALDVAATGDRDEASARIMAETVHELATDTDRDLPPAMRDSMGHMLAMWMDDVNGSLGNPHGHQNPLDPGGVPWTYGLSEGFLSGQAHAYFDSTDVFEVMREAAKDPRAYQQMWDHQRAYTATQLEYVATHSDDPAGAIEHYAARSAHVFGVLSEAKGNAIDEIYEAQDAAHNAQVQRDAAMVNHYVGSVAGAIPYGGGLAGAGGDWLVHHVAQESMVDSTPMSNEQVAKYYSDKGTVKELVRGVMYRHEIGEPVPRDSILRSGDGNLVPPTAMTNDQSDAFNSHNNENEDFGNTMRAIDGGYANGWQEARQSSEGAGEEKHMGSSCSTARCTFVSAAVAVSIMSAACSSSHEQQRPDPTPVRAAPPSKVCDGVLPGRALARILGSNRIYSFPPASDFESSLRVFRCVVLSRENPHDPSRVTVFVESADWRKDRTGETLDPLDVGSFADGSYKEISTELGKAVIGPHGGLFFPVCNGERFYTIVDPYQAKGRTSYDAVRAIGVAVEEALDEAQDCKENDDSGAGDAAMPGRARSRA